MTSSFRRISRILGCLVCPLPAVACGADGGDSLAGTDVESSAASTSGEASTTTGDGSSTAADTTGGEPGWELALTLDEDVGALFSVWGPNAAHVYTVGGQQGAGGISTGALLVRTQGGWTPATLPTDTPKLHWIHGGPSLRVAVGERGAILTRDGDGDATPWDTVGCATVLPLWGAWVVADDDAWVVGGDGFDRAPVLCHYDGAAWTQVELPALSIDAKALFKVFAVAADDVWAVGDAGLVLRYDGAAWTQVAIDTPSDIISLWGTGPGELLAVGGRANGVLARHDGAAWSVTTLGDSAGLNGIWMDADGHATAVGIAGTILDVAAASTMPARTTAPTNLTLHAVWSPGDGTFIAVGGSLEMPPPLVGVIVERN